MDYKEDMNLQYIEKLELQLNEIKEIELLEKHSIINDTFSVNKYNGHNKEFLLIGGNYDDGYIQLKETIPFIRIKRL